MQGDPREMKANIRITLIGLGFGALLVTTGCGNQSEATTDKKEDEAPPVPVEVVAATEGSIDAFYSGTATLEAEDEAGVVAKVGGVVEEIKVEEGDSVKAGDVLARIEDDRLKLEVRRARANLDKLEQEYRRNRELLERNLVSEDTVQRQRHELASLRASLELSELQLSYTRIRAPIDGVVSERLIKAGNMVSQNEVLFRITDFDPLLARMHVPERELGRLAPGQPAHLTVDALPGEDFKGHVDRISPVVDPESGTFRVTVRIETGLDRLKPGMFGRLRIIHETRDGAVLVPTEALMHDDGKASLFVVEDGTAKRRTVTTGYREDDRTEIREGVAPGEQVVVVGQATLKDGARVNRLGGSSEETETPADETPSTEDKG